MGRGKHRGDAQLLPIASPASQASEVDEHVGAAQRGDKTAHAGGPNLSERGKLPTLVRALATESHENWVEATRYLTMDLLKEHRKEMLQKNTAA